MNTIDCTAVSVKRFNEEGQRDGISVRSDDGVVDRKDLFVLNVSGFDHLLGYLSPEVQGILSKLTRACHEQKPQKKDEVVAIQTRISVDGLHTPIPVVYETKGKWPIAIMQRSVELLLGDIVAAIGPNLFGQFLKGHPQQRMPRGTIRIEQPGKRSCKHLTAGVAACSLDASGSYDSIRNAVHARIEPWDLRFSNFSEKKLYDLRCTPFATTLRHELVHAIRWSGRIDMKPVVAHYQKLLRRAFPNDAEHQDYLRLRGRIYGRGKPSHMTTAEVERYWSRLVPKLERHFLREYAAGDDGEYLAESGAAYLTTCERVRNNRKRLKAIDPEGYALMRQIFENDLKR